MNNVLWHCATVFSVGLLPAGGTVASFLALPFYFLENKWLFFVLCLSFVLSKFAIAFGQKWYKKKDPSQIVIDEFVAALLLIWLLKVVLHATLTQVFFGLVIFRFFDATKVLGLRSLERISGIWGVLLDDVGAALYSFMIFYFLL